MRLSDLRSSGNHPQGIRWAGTDENPSLILQVNPAPSGVVARFDLPFQVPAEFLHLKVRFSAKGLIPGQKLWEDGRCIIDWYSIDKPAEFESDGFGTARYDDSGEINSFVMHPTLSPAIPKLRLENLGVGGELQLSFFEATIARERWTWKIGRWILMAGWIAWAFAWIRSSGNKRVVRALLASIVWLLTGIYFVVPGPWRIQRSIGPAFELGGQAKFSQIASSPVQPGLVLKELPINQAPEPLKSVGEMKDKAGFALRMRHYAHALRPVLHCLLLFGPALLITCLVGRKPALPLTIVLALAVEAAQWGFGYGFDSTDLFDLACNATGITLALASHHHLKRRFPRTFLAD